MTLLRYLAGIFIDTFGITHPTTDQRDRAARYIALSIILLVLLLCSFIAFAVHAVRA
jgi:hypothetical protein